MHPKLVTARRPYDVMRSTMAIKLQQQMCRINVISNDACSLKQRKINLSEDIQTPAASIVDVVMVWDGS